MNSIERRIQALESRKEQANFTPINNPWIWKKANGKHERGGVEYDTYEQAVASEPYWPDQSRRSFFLFEMIGSDGRPV